MLTDSVIKGESMLRSWIARRVLRVASLLTVVGLVGGCSGEAEKTAAFPDTKPITVPTAKAATTPAKGMDRVGSESGTPNP
jgi:hypothetical protein